MNHFPIFMHLEGRRVIVSGGGEAALAKLRLLLKTTAQITVVTPEPAPEIEEWAKAGRLRLIRRGFEPGDALCAVMVYGANEDDALDAQVRRIAQAEGALVNVVDNLEASQFITPAIVDRDPVTVAIGTEGAAPVLARRIKRDLEEALPAGLGTLAAIGKTFRPKVETLPMGRKRRDFWAEYYDHVGPQALEQGPEAVLPALRQLLDRYLNAVPRHGHVDFVGAGPGDPDLLTMKARRALDKADVILHDRLVPLDILELARREAVLIEVGKTGFGPAMAQADISDLIVTHARDGAHVVRLKSGDPTIFGCLDEEITALEAAQIPFAIVPGITAASGAAAALGQSLTQRGRNSGLRIVTGHDVAGYAEQDWAALAQPGQIAAIYMGKRATRFLQGRLLMFGADPATPISIVAHVSQPGQTVTAATLSDLPQAIETVQGPAVLMLGLAPRAAAHTLSNQKAQA